MKDILPPELALNISYPRLPIPSDVEIPFTVKIINGKAYISQLDLSNICSVQSRVIKRDIISRFKRQPANCPYQDIVKRAGRFYVKGCEFRELAEDFDLEHEDISYILRILETAPGSIMHPVFIDEQGAVRVTDESLLKTKGAN